MNAKRNKSGLLLAAAAAVLIVLLGYRILSARSECRSLAATIDLVEEFIRSPAPSRPVPPEVGGSGAPPGREIWQGRPEDWVFNGLSFYEIKEIDRFFVEKIRESSSTFVVHPPRELYGAAADDGIRLQWRGNPLNADNMKKLAGNPLLQMRYKIYRWTKESQPAVVARLAADVEEFLDRRITPTREDYYYCVVLALEGSTGDDRIIIESERSNILAVASNDRFTIKVTGRDQNAVYLTITIKDRGRQHTESFRVAVGEPIGSVREVPGIGPLDFSTGLTLRSIEEVEEERLSITRIPVFNSDGSITIDASTHEPVYRESAETRPIPVISIECEDVRGRKRMFKES